MISQRTHTIRLSEYKRNEDDVDSLGTGYGQIQVAKQSAISFSPKTIILEPPKMNKIFTQNDNLHHYYDNHQSMSQPINSIVCENADNHNNYYPSKECDHYDGNNNNINMDTNYTSRTQYYLDVHCDAIANCCQQQTYTNNIRKLISSNDCRPSSSCCCCTCYSQIVETNHDEKIVGIQRDDCNRLLIDKMDCDSITNQLSALVLNLDRYKPFSESRESQRKLKLILPIYYKMLKIISNQLLVSNDLLLVSSKIINSKQLDYKIENSSHRQAIGDNIVIQNKQSIQHSRLTTLRYIESLNGYSSSTNTLRLILKLPSMVYVISAYEDIANQLR